MTKMLTVACFVFKGMSETVSINDNNNNNLHLAHDKCTFLVVVLMLSVVCFVFRRKSEC